MADEARTNPLDEHALEHPEVGFEPTDIRLRGVLAVLVVFACLLPFHQYLMLKLLDHDRRRSTVSEEAGFPPVSQAAALPRGPRLEQLDRLAGIEASDVYRREEAKESILHSYGPTREKGFVHVPIDWAIEQAANQLPFRAKQPRAARDRGLIDAGESNSGRMFREPGAK
jgi:hypothetical protein